RREPSRREPGRPGRPDYTPGSRPIPGTTPVYARRQVGKTHLPQCLACNGPVEDRQLARPPPVAPLLPAGGPVAIPPRLSARPGLEWACPAATACRLCNRRLCSFAVR